jgi:CBS domain-containing membrane protein
MSAASTSTPDTLWLQLRALFWPAPMAVSRAERLRMVAGALLGIGVTAWLSHRLGAPAPLTQPWAVVAGNTVSALVGVACVHLIPATDLAAAAAVALAIGAMLLLRCLHPPGGASALLMVMSGVADPRAALFPVLVNSLLLASMGWAFHRATGHRYPHRVAPPQPGQVTEEDLDAVLGRYNQILDVSRDELRELIDRTQRLAHQRRLADTRCADVMTREVLTVEYGTSLQEAWTLLRKEGLKSLPVVDRGRHVVGIVTLTDFLDAASLDVHQGFDQRLRRFMSRSPNSHTDKPEVVGQIMTRKVRVTRPHRTLSDLVLLFNSTGHRHIPVVGEGGKLVGMVTQSDVVAALKVADHLDAPHEPVPA